jgi:hypothetical protein
MDCFLGQPEEISGKGWLSHYRITAHRGTPFDDSKVLLQSLPSLLLMLKDN